MSSKGRKIAKNLGKSLRKKFDSDSQTDDLQQRVADLNRSSWSPTHFGSSTTAEMRPSGAAASTSPIGKSTSLSTIGNDPGDPVIVDHSEIIALTHDVKNFSDTLAKMKILFIDGLEPGDVAHVVMQESLGEVLAVLKATLQRYPALQSPEIFTAARALINKIKSYDQEELQLEEEELQVFLDSIDQVALAFSRSVSEYLMGDIVTQQQLNTDTKVKSCDNIAKAAHDEAPAEKQETKKTLTPAELDAVLVGLEAGLDLALQRAKAWSRYTRDIISYIEKKSQLELEYAKNLARIANTMQPVLTNGGFLPLQSVFCTALSQDAEFASNLQASQALMHTSKFVEPLTVRRNEFDRVRKVVKETWDRELRRMQDTVNNLRKAQALYVSRQQDLERVRETLQKADGDKVEKRKKLEEESMHKSAEAETTYKACVAEANHRQRSLEKNKVELLGRLREQILMCDQVIKTVTVEYFSLLHTVWSPVPVQYQTLSESSSGYEAGCQYAEFIKRLPSSASKPSRTEEFTFEFYTPGQKAGEARKVSVHSNGSSGEHIHSNEGSPLSSPRRDKYRIPVNAWGKNSGQATLTAGGSDTDSASGSNKSHESSPSSSPHDLLRRQIVSSQSFEELGEDEAERLASNTAHQKRSQMKRTHTVGGEDSLELPGILTNQRGARRNTMFGVDFQEQVEHYKSQVPPIITQCLAEIERRGVMIKGIYRVSGVKSKVETLCQRFDLDPEMVDLEEVHPNIISNVLKLYLRQLPEPLLTFRLYSDFIHIAKENMAGALLGEKVIERLAALGRKLPPSNFRTCAVLMHHLHRVAAHSDMNQMSSSNLGIVFGPTLLRPLEGTASLASLVDTPHQTRAIELLITNAEAVFGPGDDYQLVPDQTLVEDMQQSTEGLSITVPTLSSSEPSPEKSPTKLTGDSFPVPVLQSSSTPSATMSVVASASTLASTSALAPLASPVDDSAILVADPVCIAPSLEPSAADFSLPGSASQDKDDSVFIDNPTGAPVDGRGLTSDPDDASLSSLDGDDDDITELMLPDQSPGPHSHTPLLTPQCIADPKSAVKDVPVMSFNEGPSVSATGATSPPSAPASVTSTPTPTPMLKPPTLLADTAPAPDTTLSLPLSALTVDSSTWPGRAGPGVSVVAAGPTAVKPTQTSCSPTPLSRPQSSPSSPSAVRSHQSSVSSTGSDGRLSPTKGDSRADRFRLEQRKLLCAIKSDPKLGITGEEEGGAATGGRADTRDQGGDKEEARVEKEGNTDLDLTVRGVTVDGEIEPLEIGEIEPLEIGLSGDVQLSPESSAGGVTAESPTTHSTPLTARETSKTGSGVSPAGSHPTVPVSKKEKAGGGEVKVKKSAEHSNSGGGEVKVKKSAERSDSGGGEVKVKKSAEHSNSGGGEVKVKKSAERSDSGGKMVTCPARTGIRLGTRSASPRTDGSAGGAASRGGGQTTSSSKYTSLSTKTRATPTSTSVAQRRSVTGLNGGNSAATTPTITATSSARSSVLSRYPPTSTTSTAAASRRPVPSQPPSSTSLSRSSSGSGSGSPRRPSATSSVRQSFESSLRNSASGPSSSASSSDSSLVGSSRARRASGTGSREVGSGKGAASSSTSVKLGATVTSGRAGSSSTKTSSPGNAVGYGKSASVPASKSGSNSARITPAIPDSYSEAVIKIGPALSGMTGNQSPAARTGVSLSDGPGVSADTVPGLPATTVPTAVNFSSGGDDDAVPGLPGGDDDTVPGLPGGDDDTVPGLPATTVPTAVNSSSGGDEASPKSRPLLSENMTGAAGKVYDTAPLPQGGDMACQPPTVEVRGEVGAEVIITSPVTSAVTSPTTPADVGGVTAVGSDSHNTPLTQKFPADPAGIDKSPDDSQDSNSQATAPSGCKDLSADRTPRFV